MQSYRSSFLGNIPPVVRNLIIANVIVFAVQFLASKLGFDFNKLFALYSVQSEYFQPFQFVSYMFLHSTQDIWHIFFNMFALYMFGRMLETVWGGKRFLIYYFVTGIGAALLHGLVNYYGLQNMMHEVNAFANTPSPDLLLSFVRENLPNANMQVNDFINNYSMNPDNPAYVSQAIELVNGIYNLHVNIPTVGASGAVFGVLLAFGMLFPNTQLMLMFPPIPIRAKYFVIIYGAIEMFAVVFQRPGDNVAHLAHLGGMAFGFLLIRYWNSKGIGKYDRF